MGTGEDQGPVLTPCQVVPSFLLTLKKKLVVRPGVENGFELLAEGLQRFVRVVLVVEITSWAGCVK